MAFGSDLGFYGSYGSLGGGGGFGGYLSGLIQPWQRQAQSPYLGFSSYVPGGGALPATAAGFVESYIPELAGLGNLGGRLGPGVQEAFKAFRFGGGAGEPGAAQSFAEQLLGREDIQGLLQTARLQEESPFLEGAEGARGLGELVTEQLGTEGSVLANLYRPTGFGAAEVAEDIRRFMSGEASGLGGLSSKALFGRRGEHTEGSRAAVLAQILGGGAPVNLGGGRVFNPASLDILSDEYQFGLGRGGAIGGTDILELGGGILSSQDAGLSAGVARALGTAGMGSGFGGKGGYGLQTGFRGLADLLGEGQTFQQQGTPLQQWIDQWYSGQAGAGFGQGFGDWMRIAARQQGLTDYSV